MPATGNKAKSYFFAMEITLLTKATKKMEKAHGL